MRRYLPGRPPPLTSLVRSIAALAAILLLVAGCVTLNLNVPAEALTAVPEVLTAVPAAASAVAQPTDRERTPTRSSATAAPRPTASPQGGQPAKGGYQFATPQPGDKMPTIKVDQLPAEGRKTASLIAAGGPFPYRQDGQEFQNRERLLPLKPAGYYKEYTVDTPGSADRGARRLIGGSQGELYYTDDHYVSFKRVVP
jgi:ribonuclease T1